MIWIISGDKILSPAIEWCATVILQMAACAADRDQGPKNVLQRLSDGFNSVKGGQDRKWRGLIRILDRTPTWMHDGGVMDLPRVASCACRFAAFSLKGKGPLSYDEEISRIEQSLASMSYEEQKAIFERKIDENIKDKKGRYKGRTMSLKKALEKEKADREHRERGGGRNTMNEIEENQARILDLNPIERNPGATAMQLTPEEAEDLDLTRISNGIVNKGFWGGNQFAFGLFADTDNIPEVLGKKWANREPNEVLADTEFYHDIIDSSPKIGLTVLVMPMKKLSLYQMQREYKQRLSMTMEKLNASKKDMKDLDNLVGMFDGDRLRGMVPWVSGTRILPDTMIYFGTQEDGGLKVEVTNPGRLAEQFTMELGIVKNPKLTYAVLCEVLGNKPLDKEVRDEAANNVLYFANGFTSRSNPNNVNQISMQDNPSFKVHSEEIRPEIFKLGRAQEGRLLLKGKKMYKKEFIEGPVHENEAGLVLNS